VHVFLRSGAHKAIRKQLGYYYSIRKRRRRRASKHLADQPPARHQNRVAVVDHKRRTGARSR